MKKAIRLTESDLHRIIKESVNMILKEGDWKTFASAAESDEDPERAKRFAQHAKFSFNRDFGHRDKSGGYKMSSYRDEKIGRLDNGAYGYSDVYDEHPTTAKMWAQNPDKYDLENLPTKDEMYDFYGSPYIPDNYAFSERGFGDIEDDDNFKPSSDVIAAKNRGNEEIKNWKKGNFDYKKGEGWKLDKQAKYRRE
jgi:hypothetical protein